MVKTCPKCKKDFEVGRGKSHRLDSIFCSRVCLMKDEDVVNGIAKGTIGAISELIVCTELLKKGYAVFRAVSQSTFCDLVVFKDSKVIKIEVKTLKSKEKPVIKSGDIDIFACYSKKEKKVRYFNTKLKEQIL